MKKILLLLIFTLTNHAYAGFVYKTSTNMWKNGVIPYVIDPLLPNQERILSAIDLINSQTNVSFVPKTHGDKDYLVIVRAKRGTDCYSYMGKIGGRQELNFGDLCHAHDALHELGHVIGLAHEHQRPDRDLYVRVRPVRHNDDQTVDLKSEANYIKVGPYDIKSAMHYNLGLFTTPTGENLYEVRHRVAHKIWLSEGDIQTINLLYP